MAVAVVAVIAAACSSSKGHDDVAPAATTATPSAGASTAASSAPNTGPPDSSPLSLPGEGFLEPGRVYVNPLTEGAVQLSFRAPSKKGYVFALDGTIYLSSDSQGEQSLVVLLDLDMTDVVTSATIDLDATADSDGMPAPGDTLAWFAALAGVTAGPETSAAFAGQSAKSITYTVSSFEGEGHCASNSEGVCLPAFLTPTGFDLYYRSGDAGTMYQLDVDGHRVLVDVSDRPGATELADSMTLTAIHR